MRAAQSWIRRCVWTLLPIGLLIVGVSQPTPGADEDQVRERTREVNSKAGQASEARPPLKAAPRAVPEGTPILRFNDSARAAATAQVLVYSNTIAPISFFFGPGNAAAGFFVADDISITDPGCSATSYELATFALAGTDAYNVQVELYDGDPCAGGAPIPGTAASFPGVPDGNAAVLTVDLSAAPPVIPGSLFMRATFSTDAAGWVIAEEAEIGSSADSFSANLDTTNDGAPDTCGLFNLGPPPDPPPQASFWAGIHCQGTTQQDVADYIRDNILGGDLTGVNLWMTDTALDDTNVARDEDPQIQDTPFPYPLTWAAMINEEPDADWGHPISWVLVNDNLQEHIIITEKDWPPTVFANNGAGPEVNFECAGVTPLACPLPGPAASDAVAQPAQPGRDQDCLHAVLVSGGGRPAANHTTYSNNLKVMYNKLRGCGYPKANIDVYYNNGGSLDLDNLDGDGSHATGSDVSGTASEANFRTQIQNLCDKLDPDRDVLFIYITNHGKKNAGAVLWDFNGNGTYDANEIYTPAELAADTANCKVCRLFVVIDTCFSGQFLGLATDGDHANTSVYVSTTANNSSYSNRSAKQAAGNDNSEYIKAWSANDPATSTMNEMHPAVLPRTTPGKAEGTAGNGNVSLCVCWAREPGWFPDFDVHLWDIEAEGIWRREVRTREVTRWYQHYDWVSVVRLWLKRRAERVWIWGDALSKFNCHSHCIYQFPDGRVWRISRWFTRVDLRRFRAHYRVYWVGWGNPVIREAFPDPADPDPINSRFMLALDQLEIVLPMNPQDPDPVTPFNENVQIMDEDGVTHFLGEPGFENTPDTADNPDGFLLVTTAQSTALLPPAAERILDLPPPIGPGMALIAPGVLVEWLSDDFGNGPEAGTCAHSGGGCTSDADCLLNPCEGVEPATCSLTGGACESNSNCPSNVCQGGGATCVRTGFGCVTDGDCPEVCVGGFFDGELCVGVKSEFNCDKFLGLCVPDVCLAQPGTCTVTGGTCTSNTDCPTNVCGGGQSGDCALTLTPCDSDGDCVPDVCDPGETGGPVDFDFVLTGQEHQGLIGLPSLIDENILTLDQGNVPVELVSLQLLSTGVVLGAQPGDTVIGPPVDLDGDGLPDGPIGAPIPLDPTVRDEFDVLDPEAKPVEIEIVEEDEPDEFELADFNQILIDAGLEPVLPPFKLCIKRIHWRRLWTVTRRTVMDVWDHHWRWVVSHHFWLQAGAYRVWLTEAALSSFESWHHHYVVGQPPEWLHFTLEHVRWFRVCYRIYCFSPNQIRVKIDELWVVVPINPDDPDSDLMLLTTESNENRLPPPEVMAGIVPDPLPVDPNGVFIEPIDPIFDTLDMPTGGTGIFDGDASPLAGEPGTLQGIAIPGGGTRVFSRGASPFAAGQGTPQNIAIVGNEDLATALHNNQLQLFCWRLFQDGKVKKEDLGVIDPVTAQPLVLTTTPTPAIPVFEDETGTPQANPTMMSVNLVATDCGDLNCELGEDSCNCAVDCGSPLVVETGFCDDGIDNDCDGRIDCVDIPDCPPCCLASSPPELVQIQEVVGGSELVELTRNRLIGLKLGDPGQLQRVRVTFVDLPSPFNDWNGTVLWVAELFEICNLPGIADPKDPACASTSTMARLSCDPSAALTRDWTTVGDFYIVDPGIVPSSATTPATYEVAVLGSECNPKDPGSFATLEVINSLFGDIGGGFDPAAGLWVAPDLLVGIPTDILSMIAAFSNTPGNPTKTRADVEPCVLDFLINIIDIVRALDGFRGLPFPFEPGVLDCPLDPCG